MVIESAAYDVSAYACQVFQQKTLCAPQTTHLSLLEDFVHEGLQHLVRGPLSLLPEILEGNAKT